MVVLDGERSPADGSVIWIGPYDVEQAAAVELAQAYRCFVPVQETQGQAAGRACCSFARGGSTRGVKREGETSEGAL